jgi:hypothetical protein
VVPVLTNEFRASSKTSTSPESMRVTRSTCRLLRSARMTCEPPFANGICASTSTDSQSNIHSKWLHKERKDSNTRKRWREWGRWVGGWGVVVVREGRLSSTRPTPSDGCTRVVSYRPDQLPQVTASDGDGVQLQL